MKNAVGQIYALAVMAKAGRLEPMDAVERILQVLCRLFREG